MIFTMLLPRRRSYQDVDLFLEDDSFGYFLGLIRFGHVVGLLMI